MYVIIVANSGVAGPLAARGGGQICRPFVLGFGNWRACLKYKSHVIDNSNISVLVSSENNSMLVRWICF